MRPLEREVDKTQPGQLPLMQMYISDGCGVTRMKWGSAIISCHCLALRQQSFWSHGCHDQGRVRAML